MNPVYSRAVEMAVTGLVGLLMLMMPRMSKRGLLFGVVVGDGFRDRVEAREAIAAYQWTVGGALFASIVVLFFAPAPELAWARAISVSVIIGAPMVAHAWQFRRLRRYAVIVPQTSELEVSQAPDAMPDWIWLNAVPLLVLACVAAYSSAHWAQIPERFPTHWGLDGQPNRWSVRSVRGVYGPLIQGALLWAEFLMVQLVTWHGSRRRPMRVTGLKLFLFAGLLAPTGMAAVVMQPFLGPAALLLPAALSAGLLASLIWLMTRARREGIEPTPNECWHGGMIYYNPDDAALVVERRDSLGWTLNFANSWAWIMTGGLLLVAAAGPLILR